jgi:hypothetical protein
MPIKVFRGGVGSRLPGSDASIKKASSLRVWPSENSTVVYHYFVIDLLSLVIMIGIILVCIDMDGVEAVYKYIQCS